MTCTRCDNTGFLNVHQLPDGVLELGVDAVLVWIKAQTEPHDVQVCDCCGDGELWNGAPGEHNSADYGSSGPYAYNGGLPECY